MDLSLQTPRLSLYKIMIDEGDTMTVRCGRDRTYLLHVIKLRVVENILFLVSNYLYIFSRPSSRRKGKNLVTLFANYDFMSIIRRLSSTCYLVTYFVIT